LEKVTVEDIMIPRSELDGVDLDNPLDLILEQLEQTPYTRVLAFRGSIDNVAGFLHSRRALQALLDEGELSRERLEGLIRDPYFVPKGTPLNRQLLNFQSKRRRSALVVDEYGDVQGLVTMADLLEEIVGEFATDPADGIADVQPQDDGSFLVDGSANLRELVRTMQWDFQTDGPKTFNGLIVEHLESLPEPGTSLLISGYPIEVVQTQDNAVKTARIRPDERREQA
jgi:Mg2+/Co2+ transporter CorB